MNTITLADYIDEHLDDILREYGWQDAVVSVTPEYVSIVAEPVNNKNFKANASGLPRRVQIRGDFHDPRTEEEWTTQLLSGYRPPRISTTDRDQFTLKDVSELLKKT